MLGNPDTNVSTDLESEYEILDELGRGATAVVYRARDRELGRDVAIKVIRPKFAEDDETVARLQREARTVAQLQHPNIVTLYAVRRLRDGGLALVMQLVPGRSLREVLNARSTLSFERVDRVLRDVASALVHAHERGIVHRDVKPENIFLDETTGHALLSDFGVARSLESDSRLTATGMAIGTPAYMSPEQIDGTELDGRSDLYSLGLVAWEMVTGRRPWDGEGLYNVIYKQKREDLPPADEIRPDTPDRLLYLIEGSVRKRPEERWRSASDLLEQASMIAPPGGWSRWHAERRKRRRSQVYAEARDRGDSVISAALETVRFQRGAALPAAPGSRTPAPQLESQTPVAPTPYEPPARRTRRVVLGTAIVMAAAATGALQLMRTAEPSNSLTTTAAALSDRRGIEVPVSGVPRGDAPSARPDTLAGAATRPADSIARPDSTASAPAREATIASSAGAIDSPPQSPPRQQPAGRSAPRETTSATAARSRSADAETLPEATPLIRRDPIIPRAAPTSPVVSPLDVPGAAPAPPRVASVTFPVERGIVAAGGRHSCLIAEDRSALCWGANDQGQLGGRAADDRSPGGAVAGGLAFAQLSAGSSHTCGVTGDGDVYCWGSNDRGQLGDATTLQRDTPVRVGSSSTFQLVRAGLSHSCGLTRQGQALCWGSNAYGQLGTGGGLSNARPEDVAGARRFGALATGWNHSCAITVEGSLYCWGSNNAGQLGDGTRDDRRTPAAVATDQRFVAVAAGNQHTCAVSTSGAVWCWGRNNFGQLGTGPGDRSQPARVGGVDDAVGVTAGAVHTCARTRAGQAQCWGRNTFGQLGDGTTTDRPGPTRVAGLSGAVSLQASGAHTCAAISGGAVYCWGYNVEGQLGDGTRNHQPRPTRVQSRAR